MHLYFICIYLCTLLHSSNSRDPEISCQLPDSRARPGKCINVKKCPYAIGNLKVGVSPVSCKLEKDPYAICCPTYKRISEQKCEGFTNILRQKMGGNGKRKRRKLILESGNKPPPKIAQNQTISNPETGVTCPLFLPTRISGGRDAFKNEYPHQVSLGYGPSDKVAWRCGGVLISSNFIATAGHCVKTKFGAPVKILLGDRFLSKPENPERRIVGVEMIFTHPDYKPPLLYNDLALIKLVADVPFSRSILPACLPQPQYRLDKRKTVTVTGFGQLGAMESTSDVLQSVDLKKFAASECSDTFMNDTTTKSRLVNGIMPSQFCAGDKAGSKDTCHGDSGSGAVVTKDYPCVFYVVGITSFGSSYCGMKQPGVYTNVLRYLDWIENIVWPVVVHYNAENNKTTTPHSSSSIHAPKEVSSEPTTAKYIPRNQRPKTTKRPFFLANTPQTIQVKLFSPTTTTQVITTISTTTMASIPKPTTVSRPPSTQKSSQTSTHLTTPFTPKFPHPTKPTTVKPTTLTPIRITTETSALLSTILAYNQDITRAKSVNNATFNVSTILSMINGI